MIKPILFNTEMVRAILGGHKYKTRRVIKPQPVIRENDSGIFELMDDGSFQMKLDGYSSIYDYCVVPRYYEGDVLWVRECWGSYCYDKPDSNATGFLYRADFSEDAKGYWFEPERIHFCDFPRWRPSIHMPREAARIFLSVVDVGVERLQDIDDKEAATEGFDWCYTDGDSFSPRDMFCYLWDKTIKPCERDKYGWDANPFVFVYTFKQCDEPMYSESRVILNGR